MRYLRNDMAKWPGFQIVQSNNIPNIVSIKKNVPMWCVHKKNAANKVGRRG